MYKKYLIWNMMNKKVEKLANDFPETDGARQTGCWEVWRNTVLAEEELKRISLFLGWDIKLCWWQEKEYFSQFSVENGSQQQLSNFEHFSNSYSILSFVCKQWISEPSRLWSGELQSTEEESDLRYLRARAPSYQNHHFTFSNLNCEQEEDNFHINLRKC